VKAASAAEAEAVLAAAAAGKPVSVCMGELSVDKAGGLSGGLHRAPFAGFAAYYIVINTAGDTPAAFLAMDGAAGLKAGARDEKLGLRGLLTGELFLENTPAVALGADAAAEAEHCRWLYMAAVASGLLLGGIDEAAFHAYRRVQFGKRITEFENTRFVLAQTIAEARAAQALLEKAAGLRDEGGDWAADAAMAKLYCTDAACRGLRKCVQVMSGRGYVRDFPEEVKLRDAKTAEVFFGAADTLKSFIADKNGVN
jgi:alkylation response protein AidB-like acyl-CoA dehydrogenase